MRAVLPFLLLLAACGEDTAPDQPQMSLNPQPIGYNDIEMNGLRGANCAYAAGKSIAPVVMAFGDYAVMKLDGKLVRFTLDPQCKEVKHGTGSRYLADDRVLDLAVVRPGAEDNRFDGSIRLSDGKGATLYSTEGSAQCGSS